jgi:uncharacterized protein with von Willebrand factor type A (vWA) domain
MASDNLLFPIFDYLRKHGVPLGVSEYYLAVAMMRDGIGIESPSQFKRLCRLLWTKSREDYELLDIAFAEYLDPQLEEMPELEVVELPKIGDDKTAKDKEHKEPSQNLRTQSLPEPQVAPQKPYQRQLHVRPALLAQASSLRSFPRYHSVRYHLIPRLPLSKRDMAGAWRQFRRFSRSGPPEDLDVDATIAEICRTGLFLHPVLQPRRRNQAGLLLLIDRQGSMLPFSPFIEALVESILRGGLLGRVYTFYFHDCPESVLFTQANLTHSVLLEEVLSRYAKDNSVLLISDAGAARGDYDGERVEETRRFVEILGNYTYLYAWLNPVPARRWSHTTAEEVAGFMPMLPLDRDGLNDAINVLRGQPFTMQL